jgi:hypothetical protein
MRRCVALPYLPSAPAVLLEYALSLPLAPECSLNCTERRHLFMAGTEFVTKHAKVLFYKGLSNVHDN